MFKLITLSVLAACFAHSTGNVEISPNIVNGNDARPGQFPYMVSMQITDVPASHRCGGGILNERWVLTAAHCIIIDLPELYTMFVGSVKMAEGGTEYRVEKLIKHPRFIPNIANVYMSNFDDIGLVKSASRIIFTEFVQPVPLGRSRISGNVPAITAGFGAYWRNISVERDFPEFVENPSALHLQYIETTVISHADCSLRAGFFNARNPFYIVKPIIHPMSHICTITRGNRGICFGDSGSMLLVNGEAVGVTISGVRLCAQVDAAPDMFARVSSYINWIEGYIHDLS